MAIHFTREPFASAWPGIEPLVAAHWNEIKLPDDENEAPKPNLTSYVAACNEGRIATFTVRDAGKIVGYATFWIAKHPQRANELGAWQDAIYLDPESRKGHLGSTFINWCDEQLAKVGVQVVYHSVREGRDFSPVLKCMGYQQIEVLWSKKLEPAKAEAAHG